MLYQEPDLKFLGPKPYDLRTLRFEVPRTQDCGRGFSPPDFAMPSQLFSVGRSLFAPAILPRYKGNQLKNSTLNVRGGISSDGVWDCSYQLLILPREKEVTIMNWEAPAFVEVKMDSEINSYQDDFKDLSEAQEPPQEVVISTDHT